MPGLNRGHYIQLTLLLLVVPAQYFLTQWKPSTSTQRNYEVQQLMAKFHIWKDKLTNPAWWKQRGRNAWTTLNNLFDNFEKYGERAMYGTVENEDDLEGESPAIEVLKYREKDGYFGGSTEIRSPRPKHVKFRIGQVVRNKKMGYRGVIVGWDETLKAPKEWIKQHIPPGSQHYVNQPNYMVFVNGNDHQSFKTAYVAQEVLEVVMNVKVVHPQMDEYFEAYDGSRYLARPWLKKLYPHDQ